MKSILDRSFNYVPAAKTDLKETFERIRKQQAEEAERKKESEHRVLSILRKKA